MSGAVRPRHPSDDRRPFALEIYIGSFKGAAYGVWSNGQKLVYESFEAGYERRQQLLVSPSRAQWQRFWRSMDEIGVWEWGSRYEPGKRFEPGSVIRDGTHWSLTIAHGGRRVESSGDNAGPNGRDLDESPEFGRLCEALSRLLGGREFA